MGDINFILLQGPNNFNSNPSYNVSPSLNMNPSQNVSPNKLNSSFNSGVGTAFNTNTKLPMIHQKPNLRINAL